MLSELDMSHSQTIPLTKAADVNLTSVCKMSFSDKCVSVLLLPICLCLFSNILDENCSSTQTGANDCFLFKYPRKPACQAVIDQSLNLENTERKEQMA